MRNWISDPFGRFLGSASIVLLAALSWHAVLLIECWECRNLAYMWILQELTFSIVHPVFFSIAVGIFVATFSLDHCLPPMGKGRTFAILGLIGLCLLMLWISWTDLNSGHLQSYELLDPCARMRDDDKLRALRDKKDRAESALAAAEIQVKPKDDIKKLTSALEALTIEYKQADAAYRKAREKSGLPGTFAKTNWITLVSVLLTAAFELFCAVLVWYFVLVIFNGRLDESTEPQLVAILLLLAVWIPARAYANFCEEQQAGIKPDNASVVFAAVILVIVFAALFINAVIDGRISWELAKYVGGAVVASITFMMVGFPSWVAWIKAGIDKMAPGMFVAICLLAVIFLGALGRRWFGPLSRARWTAIASVSSPHDLPGNALDGKCTRWTSGTPQTADQWFQVDLGRKRFFRRLVLDSSGWAKDYPRGYAVYLSNTGTDWENQAPVASGSGNGPVTMITLTRPVMARFVRIVQIGTDRECWWSIHEFNLYRY
jgi:hypothetical protein